MTINQYVENTANVIAIHARNPRYGIKIHNIPYAPEEPEDGVCYAPDDFADQVIDQVKENLAGWNTEIENAPVFEFMYLVEICKTEGDQAYKKFDELFGNHRDTGIFVLNVRYNGNKDDGVNYDCPEERALALIRSQVQASDSVPVYLFESRVDNHGITREHLPDGHPLINLNDEYDVKSNSINI